MPVLDADPYDYLRHRTHIAGIVGASENRYDFTSVALDTTLGMYRIFGCTGSTASNMLI